MSESIQTGTGTTGEKVMTEASATAGQAGQAATEVAGTAAEQTRAVVGEARQQAGNVIDQVRGRVMDEADGQAKRAAGSLRQWAEDLGGLAGNAQHDSPARSLATQVADKGHRAADYLEKQGVQGVACDLQGFARRRPGVFLGGALLAGLAVGRMAKAAGTASRSGGSGPEQAAEGPGRAVTDEPAPQPVPLAAAEPAPGTASQPAPATGTPRTPPAPPAEPAAGAPVPPPPQVPPAVGTPPDGTPGRTYPEV
ncbi:hypothetical protein D9753_25440 [Streptomyces dangxiongensis]|uniref:Uncharacterized protein n=1 Tax=Streptomyces dangxiongensis TaxID=1442032 RepID=A0A3G2JJT7_9ACTN|nr:hypothetical protein [Streptomyces dangxiongensis]AYN41665.1 hypothetical protein D9753_25440 [Streptomyces dangxiongensis]